MKSLLRLGLVALGLLLTPSLANAAACATTAYAKTAGVFSNTTTTWATTSGGATACTLTAGNAVVFDGGSGAGTYTIDENISIASLTSVGATAGILLAHNTGNALTVNAATPQTFNISGLSYCTVSAGSCTGPVVAARVISFTSTSTVNITTGASPSAPYNQFGTVTFNGIAGAFELLDNAIFQGNITFTAGTIDASTNNSSPTLGGNLTVGTGTVLTCGTGTFTFSSTTANLTHSGSGTLTCGSGTLAFSSAAVGAERQINLLTSDSIGAVTISNSGSTGMSVFYFGPSLISVTLASLSFTNMTTGGIYVFVPSNSTFTLSAAPTWAGTSGNFLFFDTSPIGTTFTFALPSSSPITPSWVAFSRIAFSGTSSTMTATNCLDLSGNNNFNGGSCTAPTFGTGGGGHIIGG